MNIHDHHSTSWYCNFCSKTLSGALCGLKCGHNFHDKCVRVMLRFGDVKCPRCKEKTNPADLDWSCIELVKVTPPRSAEQVRRSGVAGTPSQGISSATTSTINRSVKGRAPLGRILPSRGRWCTPRKRSATARPVRPSFSEKVLNKTGHGLPDHPFQPNTCSGDETGLPNPQARERKKRRLVGQPLKEDTSRDSSESGSYAPEVIVKGNDPNSDTLNPCTGAPVCTLWLSTKKGMRFDNI